MVETDVKLPLSLRSTPHEEQAQETRVPARDTAGPRSLDETEVGEQEISAWLGIVDTDLDAQCKASERDVPDS